MLVIPEDEIRRHSPGNVLGVLWRQWRGEQVLARRGVHFRTTDAVQARAAYAALSEAEFDAANARQEWANWRTIPRALSGHVEDRPLRVVDLGCGSGSSTRVLAFYCPPGSRLTGYDQAEPLLEFARRRTYRHRSGVPAVVGFVCQGVAEPLREPDGSVVATGSVEVANASGVVGHHLDGVTVMPLAAELARVLAPEGVALLDVGPTLSDRDLTEAMARHGFRRLGRWRSWLGDPTGEVVYRRG